MPRRKAGTLLTLEIEILDHGLALQSTDGSFYGYALAKAIGARATGAGLTAHGTLYKALGRMVELGMLDAEWEEPAAAEAAGRPRRRQYRVTGEGEQALVGARRSAAASAAQHRAAIA